MYSVDVVNLALAALGIPTIVSFEDGSNQARQCAKLYPVLVERVLRDHHWSFATSGADLVATEEDSFDPAYPIVCVLPTDFIRLVAIVGGSSYRMAGSRILVTRLPAKIIYTRKVTDTTIYDPTFGEALQYLLMAELAMSNTREPSLAQYYRQEYERRLAIARSIDSSENQFAFSRGKPNSKFLSARIHGIADESTPPLTFTEGNAGEQ